MLANNTNDSIPAWKVPLLERRRQQAEFERQSAADDSARLAQMPAWKREVYLKKRMQKNDDAKSSENTGNHAAELARKPAFRNPRGKSANELIHNQERSRTRNSSEPELTSDSELSDSERLIPIQRNPILQSDIQRRPPTLQNHVTNGRQADHSLKGTKEVPVICNGNGYSTSSGNNHSRPSGKKHDSRNREVKEHEEVTYGRGFVNKLLGKFKELSEKNHTRIITSNVPKRACSSDNLLNDSLYDEGRAQSRLTVGNLKYAKGKAQSMENLTTLNAEEKMESLSRKGRPLSVTNGFSPETTPNNSRSSTHTGKKTLLTVNLVSKTREPADDSSKRSVVSLVSPSAVVRETSPRPEDELPRSNIVLLTRTVFESIGTSPPIDMSNSKKRSTLPIASKTDDPKAERRWSYLGDPETTPVLDAPDGYVSNGINSHTRANNNSLQAQKASAVVDLRVSNGRTDIAASDRTSWGFEPNNVTKTSERSSNKDITSSNSEKSSVLTGSKNMPGNRESLVDSTPSPSEPTIPVFSGNFEKPTDTGRNGLILSKSEPGSSQVVQMQSRNGESQSRDSISGDSSLKSETTRQHLILDLKDLPILAQTPVQCNDRQHVEKQSASVDSKNRKKGPGSLLIRPASNLLASSTKVEYLNLTKYNDVTTGEFAPPKKRPLYYDDDSGSSVPVTNLDDVMGDDDARFSPKEGDPSVYKSHTPTFEFEGAGVLLGRSLLVKSRDSKQV